MHGVRAMLVIRVSLVINRAYENKINRLIISDKRVHNGLERTPELLESFNV